MQERNVRDGAMGTSDSPPIKNSDRCTSIRESSEAACKGNHGSIPLRHRVQSNSSKGGSCDDQPRLGRGSGVAEPACIAIDEALTVAGYIGRASEQRRAGQVGGWRSPLPAVTIRSWGNNV